MFVYLPHQNKEYVTSACKFYRVVQKVNLTRDLSMNRIKT